MRIPIETDKAAKAIGPYSQAVKAGGLLFISGQLGIDPESGTIKAVEVMGQTKQAMENIAGILDSEGLTFADVVKTTVFVADLREYARINDVYGSYFSDNYPARSAVQVAQLPKAAKVEIEAIAVLRGK